MDSKGNNISKRFFVWVMLIFISLVSVYIAIVYWVDPFFQYRVKDNQYFILPVFVNPGLARNGDYNTVIIGSSMIQNFDLSILRKKPNIKPVKLGLGGMNIPEIGVTYNLTKKDQVKTFIINFDLPQFNLYNPPVKYPDYLYKDGVWNKMKYLFSYDAAYRYTPVNIVLPIWIKYGKNVPESITFRTKLDNLGNFISESEFSKERVKSLYLSGQTVTFPQMDGMEDRMRNNLDSLQKYVDFNTYKDKEYIIMFPPFSALYWHLTKSDGYHDQYIKFTKDVITTLGKYKNVKILFYCDMDEIINLDNYTDITHYSPQVAKVIVENIFSDRYIINQINMDKRMSRLDSLVQVFEQENADWLKK